MIVDFSECQTIILVNEKTLRFITYLWFSLIFCSLIFCFKWRMYPKSNVTITPKASEKIARMSCILFSVNIKIRSDDSKMFELKNLDIVIFGYLSTFELFTKIYNFEFSEFSNLIFSLLPFEIKFDVKVKSKPLI